MSLSDHFQDHVMLLHSEELILTKLLKSLRVHFANETPILKILDEYLLVSIEYEVCFPLVSTPYTVSFFLPVGSM